MKNTNMQWMAALACAIATTAAAPAQSTIDWVDASMATYERGSKRQQEQHLRALRAAVNELECVHLDGVRAAAARGRGRLNAQPRASRSSASRRALRGAMPDANLPSTARYVFGHAAIAPMHNKRTERQRAERFAPMRLALLGMAPDADFAVAELMAKLDTDRGADAFARFLDSWEHEGQGFYEALDRTAGTEAGVFYFDDMLDDFAQQFGRGRDEAAKAVRKGRAAAQRALHASFLAYRQYRAFREAIALSLVLPPDVALPQRLERYEHVHSGYSLRDMVTMVMAVHDYDADAVVDAVIATAPPLPQPLWSATYEPFQAWNEVFAAAVEEIVGGGQHTDDYLEQAVLERAKQAHALRAAATDVLGVASLAAQY